MSAQQINRGRNAWRDLGKPRRYRTDNTCKGKRRFVTDPEARAAALVTIEEQGVTRLWIYRCRHCNGWHLTSSNEGWAMLVTR